MLDSPVHEFRLAGFLALVEKYRKSPQSYKGEIADFYFARGGFAFVFALLRSETVSYIKRYAASVVALSLVKRYAIGIHGPVVVGSIEYVCSRYFYSQCFVEEGFA